MYTPHALSDCTSLREVTLPAALTAIGDYAFITPSPSVTPSPRSSFLPPLLALAAAPLVAAHP